MRRSRPIACIIGALGACLAGCNATYTVDIANRTRVPIDVRLMQDLLNQDPLQLAHASLQPGEEVRLGPVDAQITDDVNMEVERPSESGLPADRTRLYPGRSGYDVVTTERAWSGIEIRKRSR